MNTGSFVEDVLGVEVGVVKRPCLARVYRRV